MDMNLFVICMFIVIVLYLLSVLPVIFSMTAEGENDMFTDVDPDDR